MTAPMTPAPVPTPGLQEAPPPPVAPGQDQTQAPAPVAPQDQQGGQSATDAAADSADPMAWLTAAEMDSRFMAVARPALQTGVMG